MMVDERWNGQLSVKDTTLKKTVPYANPFGRTKVRKKKESEKGQIAMGDDT